MSRFSGGLSDLRALACTVWGREKTNLWYRYTGTAFLPEPTNRKVRDANTMPIRSISRIKNVSDRSACDLIQIKW